MTASTTTGGAPFVVGLGGTLRSNSSTERALRYCLESVERQGGRTKLFCGDELELLAAQLLTFARAAWETA